MSLEDIKLEECTYNVNNEATFEVFVCISKYVLNGTCCV